MTPLRMPDLGSLPQSGKKRLSVLMIALSCMCCCCRYCELGDTLCELGRFGQKVGKGWYKYGGKNGRELQEDPAVDELLQAHRAKHGITPRSISDAEIVDRCFLPLINEGFKVLHEGIAQRPGDIDIVWSYG